MKHKGIRYQRARPGYTRIKIGSCVRGEIERRVRHTADRFGVSRSFVIAVALADYFGVDVERFDRKDGKR